MKKPAEKRKWLRVCPNCGYQPREKGGRFYPSRMRCPVCFYHGPTIEIQASHYGEMKFAHQRIPEKDEGKLVWPEIVIMLIVSAILAYAIWKLLGGA